MMDELPSVREALERAGAPDPQQVAIWRAMTPVRRLEIAFAAYQFVLDVVRLSERARHPDDSPDELTWRVARRMQGDSTLGREAYGTADQR